MEAACSARGQDSSFSALSRWYSGCSPPSTVANDDRLLVENPTFVQYEQQDAAIFAWLLSTDFWELVDNKGQEVLFLTP
ncbi:hypothetical protein GOBAR_AA17549 [Gossypium barbadense]|uniref:Uncharacterized protein n=1 Tax=Gossypium barbadense TaxID=3634 RepID=A0A2P5XIG5_GOSBA|nr:hypothetical protein GOBAR_AA17548 [Gossypium barbadense]PPS03121.1 hypothetical protein GOBAR_AA17549 [Gossypium barbadense]